VQGSGVKGQGSSKSSRDHLVICDDETEQLLGDVAIAVNPKDERYKDLHEQDGDLADTESRSQGDLRSARRYGVRTGALKVTPAHDPVRLPARAEVRA